MRGPVAVLFLLFVLSGVKKPALKVGVVDLQEVVRTWRKFKEVREILSSREESYQKELEALRREVEVLRAKLDKTDPKDAAFRDLDLELIKKEALLRAKEEEFSLSLQRAEELHLRGLQEEIRGRAEELANQYGLDLLLSKRVAELFPGGEVVLYLRQEVDFTEELATLLNQADPRAKRGK